MCFKLDKAEPIFPLGEMFVELPVFRGAEITVMAASPINASINI